MGEKWAIWALVAALASAGSAHAENVVLHVSADGARRLDKLTPALPEQLTIPRTVTEVSQCSSRNGTIDVQNGQLDLVWHDFQLDIEGDRIVIETVVDIDASGDIDVDNLACFIGASCQVGVHGDSVALRTEIALMTEEGGKLAFVPYNTMVDIGGVNGLNIDIDGCFLGSVAELAIDLIDSWAQSWFDEELGALASEALSSVLGELPLALPERLQLANYVMYSDFEYADVDPAAGITVGASARIGSSFGTIPSLDENAPAPTEPAIVGEGAADFQLAASDQLVSSALRQAWWDGAFSKLLSEGQPSFEISSDSLSQRLGLPAGTQVDVGIEVLDQPTVAFGRDEVDEVSIVLPDTVVKFTLRSPGAPAGTIELRTSGHVVGGFRIGAGGALVLEARAMQIDRLQLSTGEELLDADPARMEQLVADVVLPLLADSLESVPLAPALAPIEGLYVWIKDVGASGGWLRASFDLYSADPDDDIAPETELEDRSVVRAGLVSLKVTGYDNSTPEPLLRYRASLDGEPLKEAPYFAEQIRFNVEDGEHVLEVAAVDLNGNADPRPARVQLVVDGTPPLLDVLSAPGTFLPRGGAVSASWTSSDEREGVRSKWQIFALANNGLTGEVVAEGAAGSAGEMHVDDLNKNKLYVLRITAEDRAGNLTSEEFGFAFEQAGCRIADGGASDSAPLLLALALLAAGRRRRRR